MKSSDSCRIDYDVVIVGAGPAGIFAALELVEIDSLKVLMLEKGRRLEKRTCPVIERNAKCPPCKLCDQVSGWGGAGAYSDGKLTLSHDVGGNLREYLETKELDSLIGYVDRTYIRFGAPEKAYEVGPEAEELRLRASRADMNLEQLPDGRFIKS